jgi:hypothetical protein
VGTVVVTAVVTVVGTIAVTVVEVSRNETAHETYWRSLLLPLRS